MSPASGLSGQVTAAVLVGLVLVGVPAGLALAGVLDTSSKDRAAIPTVTPPSVPPATATGTAEPGPGLPAPSPTPGGNDSGAGGSGPGPTTLVVHSRVDDVGDAAATGPDCADANYTSIQRAVREAQPGYTVRVCAGQYPESVAVDTANLTIRAVGEVRLNPVGSPAFRTTAPNVTVQGVAVRATRTNRSIVVGGRDNVVRDVTVNATEVGIYLVDGQVGGGDDEGSTVGSAAGSRIVNATVQVAEGLDFGIWTDADRTVLRANTVRARGNTTGIVSTGVGTVVRANRVTYPITPQQRGTGYVTQAGSRPAIKIGRAANEADDAATGNLIVGNVVRGAPHDGIRNVAGTTGTVIRANTISQTPTDGILVEANDTLVANNTVTDAGNDGIVIGWFGADPANVTVVGNEATRVQDGVTVGGPNATIVGNNLHDNRLDGVDVLVEETPKPSGIILNNTLTGNDGAGIRVENLPGVAVEAHYNRIWNNGGLGIHNQNFVHTDDDWPVMNATYNVWKCGGPSGGLEDPVTHRIADGTGDQISAGDEPGVSNVHFDPYLVREACPLAGSGPTATSPPSPTPTRTSTATPTPPPRVDRGTGTPGTAETATPGTAVELDGGEPGGSNRAIENETGNTGETPSNLMTPTHRPPTPSPTAAASPTPQVEPGFGVVPWVVSLALLVGVLGLRRQWDDPL